MKIKTLVSWGLVLSLFLVGNIMLFGLISLTWFFFAYIIFISIVFAIAFSLIRNLLKDKSDMGFLIAMAVVMVISISFFAENAKAYYDTSYDLLSKEELMSEIGQISAKNEYYEEYIDYLGSQIKEFQRNSDKLQSQIDKIKEENPDSASATYYYIYDDEREDEYEYEDEEDDD